MKFQNTEELTAAGLKQNSVQRFYRESQGRINLDLKVCYL